MQIIDVRGYDRLLSELFGKSRKIAIVGLSPKEERPSNMVARYLTDQKMTVIPVNPGQKKILGLPCFPDLAAIPGGVEIVDIFRRSEDVLPIVEQALQLSPLPLAIWMQQGIVNHQAAALALEKGVAVVMDSCLKVEHQRLIRGR